MQGELIGDIQVSIKNSFLLFFEPVIWFFLKKQYRSDAPKKIYIDNLENDEDFLGDSASVFTHQKNHQEGSAEIENNDDRISLHDLIIKQMNSETMFSLAEYNYLASVDFALSQYQRHIKLGDHKGVKDDIQLFLDLAESINSEIVSKYCRVILSDPIPRDFDLDWRLPELMRSLMAREFFSLHDGILRQRVPLKESTLNSNNVVENKSSFVANKASSDKAAS